MSFTQEVKQELVSLETTTVEAISQLSAIISNSIVDDKIKIVTESNNLARYIYLKTKQILKIIPKITVRNGYNYNNKSIFILELNTDISLIKEILGIKDNNLPFPFIIDDTLSKRLYISGAFLLAGSINDPKKSRYHLEFIFNTEEYSKFFSSLLNEFNLSSKILKRENKYMVYIKEAEKIADFLRIISTPKSLLYYEDIRIYRDHKNMTNRLNNCEQANVDKIIQTASNQLRDINFIKEKGCYELLDDKIKEVATYRLKYPETSLTELSEIISLETNNKITKSGLNHRLIKLKKLADKLKDKDENREKI